MNRKGEKWSSGCRKAGALDSLHLILPAHIKPQDWPVRQLCAVHHWLWIRRCVSKFIPWLRRRSEVKRASCSSTGCKFGFQHPCWVNSQPPVILAPGYLVHVQYSHKCLVHTHINVVLKQEMLTSKKKLRVACVCACL